MKVTLYCMASNLHLPRAEREHPEAFKIEIEEGHPRWVRGYLQWYAFQTATSLHTGAGIASHLTDLDRIHRRFPGQSYKYRWLWHHKLTTDLWCEEWRYFHKEPEITEADFELLRSDAGRRWIWKQYRERSTK